MPWVDLSLRTVSGGHVVMQITAESPLALIGGHNSLDADLCKACLQAALDSFRALSNLVDWVRISIVIAIVSIRLKNFRVV